MNWSMLIPEKAALVHNWNYLEDYWPCASGLSAVNTIGTQVRDTPMDAVAESWRNPVSKHQIRPEYRDRMPTRDGTAEPVS